MPNKYDHDYKFQAINLAKELDSANQAARELGIPRDTLHGWFKAVREGLLDIGEGAHTPESALTLNEELIKLRKQVKEQKKEIKHLKEVNDFLEEASAFFAASCQKSRKSQG